MKYPSCFLFLITCLYGCADTMHVYVPNAVHAPILQQKNELRFTVTPGDAQIAYSITDHIGIMADGQYLLRDRNAGNDGDFGIFDSHAGGKMWELGAGYFNRYAQNRNRSKTIEIYAGYGRGEYSTIAYNYFHGVDSSRPRRDNSAFRSATSPKVEKQMTTRLPAHLYIAVLISSR